MTDAIAVELLNGATWVEAAANLGCSRASIARRARDPEFRSRLAQERSDRLARLADRLTSVSADMVGILAAIANDPSQPPASRVRAAVAVLQLGHQARQEGDLESRVVALEHALRRGQLGLVQGGRR